MKIAKDFRSFNKIKRKYYKKRTKKVVDFFGKKRCTSYWEIDDWLGYIVKTYEEFLHPEIRDYVEWMVGPDMTEARLEQIAHLYNTTEPVTFTTYSNQTDEEWEHKHTGYFRGILLTNRDAYYLLENPETRENKLIPIFWNQDKTKTL